jgi:hypothetical protein
MHTSVPAVVCAGTETMRHTFIALISIYSLFLGVASVGGRWRKEGGIL